MPAADPASRGPRRKFKGLTSGESSGDVKQVFPSEVIDPTQLLALLDDLVYMGHALTIGRTRDGGCISLAFMVGGKPVKKYTPTREAWGALIEELAD